MIEYIILGILILFGAVIVYNVLKVALRVLLFAISIGIVLLTIYFAINH